MRKHKITWQDEMERGDMTPRIEKDPAAGGKAMLGEEGSPQRGRCMVRALKRALHLRGDEGGALVELAIMLPIFMSVLTGAASFTLAFYNLQQLQSATAGAVQAVAGTQGTIDDPCNLAMKTVQAALPGWTTSKLSFTLTVTNASGTGTAYTGSTSFSCTAAGAGGAASTAEAANEPVTLSVSYSGYSWLPILAFQASGNLSATETAMAE